MFEIIGAARSALAAVVNVESKVVGPLSLISVDETLKKYVVSAMRFVSEIP